MVRKELDTILTDEALHHVPVLILANKQDVTYALSATELKDKLALNGTTVNRFIRKLAYTIGINRLKG